MEENEIRCKGCGMLLGTHTHGDFSKDKIVCKACYNIGKGEALEEIKQRG